MGSSKERVEALRSRYWDAYVYARTINGWGKAIKAIGIIIGILLAVGGLMLLNGPRAHNDSSVFAMSIMSIVVGVLVALLAFVIGLIICAGAQLLKANLDCAVNSSPFMGDENKARIMSLPD